MSPLYPYLMGIVYMITGPSPIAIFVIQSLLGIATILLVYLIAEKLLDKRNALVAAAVTGLYAPFMFYEVTLLTSTLILFLSAIIVKLSIDSTDSDNAAPLWILGITIGLSALARPLVLLYLPFLYLIYLSRDRESFTRRAGLVTVAVLVIILPVSIRNLIVGGEFTMTTSSAGMNFYVGNNEEATGLYWEAPFLTSIEPQYEDEEFRKVASQTLQRELTTREAGRFWLNRSMQWIVDDPLGYLQLLGKKVFFFWNRAEFANNISIYIGKDVSPVLRFNPIGFWLIAPLGLAGLILIWRQKGWRTAQIPFLWVVTYFTGALIFFVASEYRLPTLIALIIGAAYFLLQLADKIREKRSEAIVNLLSLGLLFGAITNFRTSFIYSGENPRMDWFNIGNTLMKANRNEEAIERFNRSLKADPNFPEAMLRLAEAYARTGQTERAVEIGKQAGLENPEKILDIVKGLALNEAYALLEEGKLTEAMNEFEHSGVDPSTAVAETTRVSQLIQAQKMYRAGDREEALQLYKKIADNDSVPNPLILNNIAFIHWQAGASDSAEKYVELAYAADSTAPQVIMLKSRILRAAGRVEEAEKLLLRVNPEADKRFEMLEGVHAVMDSLTAIGEWYAALETYGTYGRIGFDPIPEDKLRLGRLQLEIGNLERAQRLLDEAENEGVKDPELWAYRGRVLAAMERYEEAETSLQEAIRRDPENVIARVEAARFYVDRGRIEKARQEMKAVAHLEILDEAWQRAYSEMAEKLKGM